MSSILRAYDGMALAHLQQFALGLQFGWLSKEAEDDAAAPPVPAYSLAGMLYASRAGWLILSVPNAWVRGIFSAMHEPGIELPPGRDGDGFNAHISVMRPEELERIGGIDKVTERGKTFKYTTGRMMTVEPKGWPDIATCWFLKVHSPELQALRRSYGLSSLPNDGKYEFHISVAVRRKGVLGRNDTSKHVA